MVAVPRIRLVSPSEYLSMECDAPSKSEYCDGVVTGMAGATPAHNIITFRFTATIGPQLRRIGCEGYTSDQRVYVPHCNSYFYPDFSAVCETPQYDASVGSSSLLNPSLIVEVLSPATERYDRGEKYECYQTIDSLITYILIARDRPHIEVYTRQPDGTWTRQAAAGIEAILTLDAMKYDLSLSDIYSGLALQETASDIYGNSL